MLAQAIASVRAQTFIDYEIIVVSNGEGDDARRTSHDIATAHGARYFALTEANVSAARNFAIKSAKGEWIALLDDHDLWLPTKLARQVDAARQTGADLISTDYVQFYQDAGAVIRRAPLLDGWSCLKAISHRYGWALPSSVIVRKNVIQKLGGFDPRQRFGEGLDMWRWLSWGHKIHQLEEVLVRYRNGHPSTMQRERSSFFYDLRLLRYRFSPRARMRSLATRLDIMEFWERLGDM